MFEARVDLFEGTARESAVLDAARNATPESRAEFEREFGPVAFTEYVVGAEWVDAYTLTEGDNFERVRYEGEVAERICEEAKAGITDAELDEELPRPPVVGR